MLLESGFVRGCLEILPACLADDGFGCSVLRVIHSQQGGMLMLDSGYLRISAEKSGLSHLWLRARACLQLSLRCPS